MKVAENRCWSCGIVCQSSQDLQNHLHETVNYEEIKPLLDDDKYLNPFVQDDPLLYSFGQDEEVEDDDAIPFEKEEIMRDLGEFGDIYIDDRDIMDALASDFDTLNGGGRECSTASKGYSSMEMISEKEPGSCISAEEHDGSFKRKPKDKHLCVSFANVVSKEIKNVNKNYFGAYSSFGIHREMISDKVSRVMANFGIELNFVHMLIHIRCFKILSTLY